LPDWRRVHVFVDGTEIVILSEHQFSPQTQRGLRDANDYKLERCAHDGRRVEFVGIFAAHCANGVAESIAEHVCASSVLAPITKRTDACL
jgi:hypothetical protein